MRLVSPIEGGGTASKVRDSTAIERLYPATPAGGVAGRTLRYWRRDPRYLAGIAGFLIGPIVLIVTQMINPQAAPLLAVFAPSLLGLLVGFSLAQDLSYDGTALWLHISSGIRGAEDRTGRVMSTITVYLPLTVILLCIAMIITGEWQLLVPAVGLALALMLTGSRRRFVGRHALAVAGAAARSQPVHPRQRRWPAVPAVLHPHHVRHRDLGAADDRFGDLVLLHALGRLSDPARWSGLRIHRAAHRDHARAVGSSTGAGRRRCSPSPRRPPDGSPFA